MRHRHLLVVCFLGLSLLNPVLSQNKKSFFHRLISPDSLRHFDESAWRVSALNQGYIGDEFNTALELAKRQHIINTYYPNAYDISNFKMGPGNNTFNAPCVNEGFESGNFNGWTTTIGTNTNSCAYPSAGTPLGMGPTLTVVTTPYADPIAVATIPNSPLGGSKVAKINDFSAGAKVIEISQNFVVTNSNYLFDMAYYAVQNGIHNCCEQPYLFLRLRDCVGNLLACPNFTFNAPSALCAGAGGSWINVGGGVSRSNGWQVYSLDLTQYIGTCVTVELMVGDCSLSGHYMYTYFDSRCNTMNLGVNGTPYSMPTQTVNVNAPCGTTATLTAPGGLSPYVWNGPPLSGITNNTNQVISTSVPGNYTLTMNPIGVCTPIFRIVNLAFAPPASITVNPASICLGNTATLTASGAVSYTWNPGGSNATSIVASPTTTSIYTLTAKSGTCVGNFTAQVTVNPSPTITAAANNLSVCAGGPSTLTAGGASTYTWNPGALAGTTVAVSPTVTTTYSVIGTTTAGCTGTANITINVVPTPTNFVTIASPSAICNGASSNLFASAIGATGYTWSPGGLTGNTISVTPTITTVYTVVAANGNCTNSAVLTVSVSNGPTMAVVASPTAICPGGSATLSSSGALSYTWNPMAVVASSVVVSPTVTTTYTVSGVNALGCVSNSLVTEVVSPVPSITITPASPSICIGTSGTLIASGATSYTWNPGALSGATAVVNPTVNTTYTIIGSNGTCTSSTTKSLTVVPIPTVTASGSTPSVCAGSSATLTGSGATTYTWNPGGLTGVNVVVSPAVTTNYTVSGSTAGCSSTATVALTVFNGPTLTANANPNTICAGNSSTLTSTGGLSYTWNPGGLAGGTVVVNPAATTVYSVTGNNASGCTTTKTLNLTVNPNPTVTATASSPSVCTGGSATLTANGAATYTWNPGALSGSSIVVTPTANTTYTINGATLGCPGQTTIAIAVVPVPTITSATSPTAVCSGVSATLTANGGTSYTWNPGALTGSSVVVSPTVNTNYTVTGSNGACTATSTLALVVHPNPTLTATSNPTAVCITGNVTLTATGAATYTWNPGGLAGASIAITPTTTTTYSVSGTTAFGCTGTSTVNVVVNSVPVLTLAGTPTVFCAGSSSTLTALGATAYTWNPGALTGSNVVVTPTFSTIYTVTASNGGCTTTGTLALLVNNNPTVTASASPTNICAGSSSTLTGAGAPVYTWNPGGLTGNTISVNPASTTIYTLTGSNIFGCTGTATVNLIVTPNPTITASASPTAICIGGSSSLTANGGTSYTWNPGALTGANVVVSPTVTTTYTVTGSNGLCTGTKTISVIVNPTPTLTAGASPSAICLGASSTLTVTGASTYTWNPGGLTGSSIAVSPTTTSNYTVTGTSVSGCTSTAITSVTVNPLPTLSITSTATNICAGASATLTGSGALSYTWNPGGISGSTLAINPAVTTTYTLTGASALGCINTKTYTQTVTPNPTVTTSASPAGICIGGSSTLTANGGITYTWNPGALTGSNVVVSPTITTSYTVTGANGLCTGTSAINVIVNPTPTLTAGASPNAICLGSPATLTVSGASTYTWNPGALTGSNVSVSPTVTTNYTVTGTGLSGCNGTTAVSVTVNPLPSLTVTSTSSNICAGASATLTGSGGVAYVWNPGGVIGSTIAVNPAATTVYTLTGTNGFGCLNNKTFTLTVTPNPTVTASASPSVFCAGQSSTLTANGAASFTWNPGALTGSSVVVTPAVNTTYTITGANGLCTSTQTLSVIVNPVPTVVANGSPNIICAGNASTLTANGAVNYTWNPGGLAGSSIVVTPSITTSYTVTGSNASGCTNSVVTTITVNPLPTLSITSTGANVCSGSSATLTGSGASSYTWNPGAVAGSSIVITPTANTVYTLTGASVAGCTSTSQYTISVTPSPTVTASANNTVICAGSSSTLTANGATSYTWNPGALTGSNVVVTPSVTTSYTVVGMTGVCSSSAVVTITVNASPSVTANVNPTVICSGGTVTLTASGAVVYAWLPIAQNGATVATSPTVTTTYTVVGSNGTCTNSAMVTVSVNPIPSLTITPTPTAVCIGGSSTLTAGGATSYTWQPGGLNTTTISVSPTVATTYSLIGANGTCTNSTSITISVNPLPIVTATVTPTIVCGGSTVNLSASGASTYSWNPIGLVGANATDNPTITTTYTVIGTDMNGCSNQANVTVSVNLAPTITAVASPTSVCLGGSSTLTANGNAATYTWNPGAANGTNVVVNPTVTTTYTITGTDPIGCSGTQTVQLIVLPIPTITAISSPTAMCVGDTATLTANGALTYTWMPGNINTATIAVNPTVTTTYTLSGSNGTCGSGTTTLTLVVNDLPANVTASVSSNITCATPSVNLFGTTTSTNVTYLWNGPGAYTSAVQNPTGIAIPGTYTLTVFNAGGCSSSATVAVNTDSSIPTVSITINGTITCANPSATLNAVTSATNPGYNWTGPGSFTSSTQSCTITSGGIYTLTVTDLTSNCPASTLITVIANTNVPITATIIPATCNGTITNNDAEIIAGGFGAGDKFDFVAGLTYTGVATYTTATAIPAGGILTNTLSNPFAVTPYTVRFFGANGCFKDTTLFLTPTSCMTNTIFGLAKAVSTPTLKPDGTYDVNYFVVVQNSGIQNLSNIILTENLSNTFPLPTTYSIVSAPVVITPSSNITIDPTYNGSLQPVMTATTSSLSAGRTDTIMFKLNLKPNGIFGPYNNSVIGFASPAVGVVLGDSSNTGTNPDPDHDGKPGNNNLPTILNLTPNVFFGLTKMGTASDKLADNTYDLSYTITVHNLGNDTLSNVVVKDSLFNNTIRQPASYTLKSGPATTGSLVANTSFNGNSDINLIVPGQSKMPPASVNTISFVINVNPDTATVFKNSAYGNAKGSLGTAVADSSNNGSNPDTNDNGNCNEPVDNVATVLTISNSTLFVPNGFSPNGDGKNDTWLIKGLPTSVDNTLTVYNRWGNKVYQKSNYDGSWNGFPNVSGTLGNEKLPQGTYYYVIEFKGGDMKALNGFVVLQY